MDNLFKVHLLLIAGTIGLTIWVLLGMILLLITPTPLFICSLAVSWVLMIKTNPVWKVLWGKWTKKK